MTINDPLYDEALKITLKRDKISVQLLQRELGIGYARALILVNTLKNDSKCLRCAGRNNYTNGTPERIMIIKED